MTGTREWEDSTATQTLGGINRLFTAGERANYHQHCSVYGQIDLRHEHATLIPQLEASGLIGRGGAGFSVARKFDAVGSARLSRLWRPSAVVIANGAEGEPRSLKDERLLRDAPHLVIDGLLLAGKAVHADSLYLYSTAATIGYLDAAIRERRDARSIRLVEAPDSFISGEASAVVNAIENGKALPTDRTVRLSTAGLRGRPTLVHNVETLAHVALIARYGAEWFRAVGSSRDPGTRLVTVSGAVPRDRVLEVPGGAAISDILRVSGADLDRVSAVLVGGFHGAWLPANKLDTPLAPAALAPFQAHPGAGILFVTASTDCGLHISAQIARYLARESAQQCGPCMFGLPEMAAVLEDIASGVRNPRLPRTLVSLSSSVNGRGSCHHPSGTARFVQSSLTTFAADVEAHLTGHCLREAGR